MIINSASLGKLTIAYSAAYKEGLGKAESQYDKICTTVPSSTSENIYPWLGDLPSMREWVGDRVIRNLKTHDYSIKNKDFEVTIAVRRKDLEDDQYGVYMPLFNDLGNQAVLHPNQMVFSCLKAGHETLCFDGQYFFDADHEVAGKSVSNSLTPNSDPGLPWYLLCTSRALRPLVLQKRKDYTLVRKDRAEDDNVFLRGEFLYGVEARLNVGYGLWQTAVRYTHPLNGTTYAAARSAMMSFTNDEDVPLASLLQWLQL